MERRRGTRRPRAALGLVASLAAVALAACGSSGGGAASANSGTGTGTGSSSSAAVDLSGLTLKVGVSGGSAAFTVSNFRGSGVIDKLPFKVEWVAFPDSPRVLQAVQSGVVDTSSLIGDVSLPLAASGLPEGGKLPVKVVGAVQPANAKEHAALTVVANPKAGINSISDLRGHSISYITGGWPQSVLAALLKEAKLTPKDVKLVPLTGQAQLAAFQSGKVDVSIASIVQIQPAVDAIGAKTIWDSTRAGTPTVTFSYATDKRLADARYSAAIGGFVKAQAEAQAWNALHPEDLAKALMTDLHFPEKTAQASAVVQNQGVPIDAALIAAEQAQADDLHKAGFIPRTVDLAPYFDNRYDSLVTSVPRLPQS